MVAFVTADFVSRFDPDTELMLRVKAGDLDCLGRLVEKYRMPVVHLIYRMVQNQPIAEELAQDTFLRVHRARLNYEPSAKFSTWLFRIATNLTLNWIRDSRHENALERLDDPPGWDEPRREIADWRPRVDRRLLDESEALEIRRAIAGLPPAQRAVVLLHKYEGLEYSEIAQVLNCSLQSVKSRLFRAYGTLRVRLAHLAAQ